MHKCALVVHCHFSFSLVGSNVEQVSTFFIGMAHHMIPFCNKRNCHDNCFYALLKNRNGTEITQNVLLDTFN